MFVVGTLAYNSHVQNIALALLEERCLGRYETGLVDVFRSAAMRNWRADAGRLVPAFDRQLSKRAVAQELHAFTWPNRSLEGLRICLDKLGASPLLTNWLHDRSSFSLDRHCAKLLRKPEWGGFFGVEFGALYALQAARQHGKPGGVAFLSPHHEFRRRWVDVEYDKFPELRTPYTKKLQEHSNFSDARRDAEAKCSSFIHAGSEVVRQSLISAGYPDSKIITSTMGVPRAVSRDCLPASLPSKPRFVYAGAVAVHKGAHYLIDAWRKLGAGRNGELHLYGVNALPEKLIRALPRGIIVHGPVGQPTLKAAFLDATALILPTLCDGFGMVVGEALACGLPVITTRNAGASVLIRDGENGFVVEPADANALATALAWFLDNTNDRMDMRHAALHTASANGWEHYRARLRQGLRERGGLNAMRKTALGAE